MRLVGFIIKIYHDKPSPESQNLFRSYEHVEPKFCIFFSPSWNIVETQALRELHLAIQYFYKLLKIKS